MHLPLDIFTHLILYLDNPSQKSLCLTSRDLVPICQSSLFQTMNYDLPHFQARRVKILQKSAALLHQSPHLATYVRHLQYSFGIDLTESQLLSTVLKSLDRIEILTLSNRYHLEAPLIPDDLALSVLDTIRSPGLTRLYIENLPMWFLRGVGVGLTSLTIHYSHKTKTRIGAKPTEQVESALVTHEEGIMGRKIFLTSLRVEQHFLEAVRAFECGSLTKGPQSRLELSELVDIQINNLPLSFVEEVTTKATKLKRLDWKSKPDLTLSFLFPAYLLSMKHSRFFCNLWMSFSHLYLSFKFHTH